MVKLIATDMDGTLLNSKKELPPDFWETLDMLDSKNVRFCIASGRSFTTLKINFDGYTNRMNFICDNGAFIVIDGKPVSVSIIPAETVSELIKICRSLEGVTPVLCGMNGTYFDDCTSELYEEVSRFYLNFTRVDDIAKVKDDIFKVALCDSGNPMNHSLPVFRKKFGDSLSLAASGPLWMDAMNQGVNKGEALKIIQQHLGVSREETMAFGDYFNDTELLQNAEFSYAMANSHPDMFKIAKYRTDTNENCGVTKAINEFFSV